MSKSSLHPWKNLLTETKKTKKIIIIKTALNTTVSMLALFLAGPIMALGASIWTLGSMCINGLKLLRTENQDFLRSIKQSTAQLAIWAIWLIPGVASMVYLKHQIIPSSHVSHSATTNENHLINAAKRGATLTASIVATTVLGPVIGLIASTWYLGKTGGSIAKYFKIGDLKEKVGKSQEEAIKNFFESRKVNHNMHQLGKWISWIIPGVAPISLLVKAVNKKN